ncbi:hypothetical protein ACWGQ5_34670 [Streptomyces sp. NPDC055722]
MSARVGNSAPELLTSGHASHYAGPSLIQLEALDDRLAYGVTVAEGRAGEHTFQWPGRGYYQVRSAGGWSLSAT